jgi:hypothetical protein
MDVDVEVDPGPARVLADEALGVGFGDGALQGLALVDVLATVQNGKRGERRRER